MDQLTISVAEEMAGHHDYVLKLIKSGTGLVLSERIESEAGAAICTLRNQAVSQSAGRSVILRRLIQFVVTSYIAGTLLIALAVFLVYSEDGRRGRLERRLRQHEAELTRRVKERTQELQAEIASRAETENALRLADEFLEAALHFARIVVWVWNTETNSVEWLGDFSEVFGFEQHAHSYTEFLEIVHPEDRAMIDSRIAECIETGALYACTFRILGPDGKCHRIGARGGVVKGQHGSVVRMAGINYGHGDPSLA
jgi:PAS domain-containing protein